MLVPQGRQQSRGKRPNHHVSGAGHSYGEGEEAWGRECIADG